MMISLQLFFVISMSLVLSACNEAPDPAVPEPVTLSRDALGNYCRMGLFEHDGPKGQIHIEGLEDPLWFTQIRDAIAFLRSPEETDRVLAVYVNDMGRAPSWENPGNDNWIDAKTAIYVIDSQMKGGMGSPEAVPFHSSKSAEQFIRTNGGSIVMLNDIPDDYVLSAVQLYLDHQAKNK